MPPQEPPQFAADRLPTRRGFFGRAAGGICGAALTWLLEQDLYGGRRSDDRPRNDLAPRKPHFAGKAKAVIHLFMNGGPSQMDLFDPKPALARLHGKRHFEKIAGEVENVKDAGALMRSPFKFARHGRSGAWVSDALPHLARRVDELALIRSMYTTNLTH